MGKAKQKARRAHAHEHAATRRLTKFRDHPLLEAAGSAAELGDQPPLVTLNLLTIGAGFAFRRPDVIRTGVRMLAAHALATGIKAAIKANIDRTRPHAALEGKPHRAQPGTHSTHDYNSFPSGHTAGAVAVAAAIAHGHPKLAAPAHATAAAIAGVQVPRGAHYASDVAAGAVIGWLSAKLTNAAVDGVIRAVAPAKAGAASGERSDQEQRGPGLRRGGAV